MRSQLAAIAESNYGQYLAPTRAFEFRSETLDRTKRTIVSEGIRAHAGRRARRSESRVVVGRSGTGRIVMEAPVEGLGLWLEHMLGGVDTTQPQGASAAYEHEFTFDTLWDKSLTIQKGVERDDETVVPYSFVGCKIPSWELNCGVDEFLVLSVDIDARDVLTSESLVEPVFGPSKFFHFMQAQLEVEGDPIAQVTRAQITGSNPMANERYYLGSGGLKGQQKTNGDPEIGGQLTADFVDETVLVAAYHDDTPLELVLSFVGDQIEAGQDEELTITLADIRLDGETPKVQGMELPTLTIPFQGMNDGSGDLTVLLRNTDATP